MSTDLVGLAFLMFLVTYPSRAIGLLAPRVDRLPKPVLDYLQLVGPAVLTAIAAVSVIIITGDDRRSHIQIGIEWMAVLACLGIVLWRRNLFLGIVVAVAIAVVARALGASPLIL